MPSAAQVLSLVTFFRPIKKDSRLPGGPGGLSLKLLKTKRKLAVGRDRQPYITVFCLSGEGKVDSS